MRSTMPNMASLDGGKYILSNYTVQLNYFVEGTQGQLHNYKRMNLDL